MHVLVIGAGVSGLYSAKRLFDAGLEATIYEKSDQVGGTWVYTDDIDSPETGVKIHSSMYHNLRTNMPKEVSFIPDLPFPEDGNSFVTQVELLQQIQMFAAQFNIIEKITFQHEVIRVTPYYDTKWEVYIHDIKNDKYFTKIFDAVMICNGHYSTPYFASIPGQHDFKGKIIHSHNYRRAEKFKNQDVLIIGNGPSGRDISLQIAQHANTVTISHRKSLLTSKTLPRNLFQKPLIKRITENGAEFSDGTFEAFDTICYCTGYTATFPFLSVDCELTSDQNYVRSLYKHTININKPTMAIIGIIAHYTPLQIRDVQAQFVIKYWTSGKQLPSKQEMLDDTNNDQEKRIAFGLDIRRAHYLAYRTNDYYNELAIVADIPQAKPVWRKIFIASAKRRDNDDVVEYKSDCFRIVDDTNFIRITNGVEYVNQ